MADFSETLHENPGFGASPLCRSLNTPTCLQRSIIYGKDLLRKMSVTGNLRENTK
jgi:hypothetical protein